MPKLPAQLRSLLVRTFLAAGAGLLAGGAAALFLTLLDLATRSRENGAWLVYLLPLAGFLIGWIYLHYGGESVRGNTLVLEEIHGPQRGLPASMAPLILGSTLLTHLTGGSAGREGTAVQMGAALADQLGCRLKISAEDRRRLLVAGAGAGFGAAIGAPLAGALFGMEVVRAGRLKPFAVWESLVASLVGYLLTRALGAPHTEWPAIESIVFSWPVFLAVALSALAFGLVARIFVASVHAVARAQARFIAYPPLRPFLGGILVLGIFTLLGTRRYEGLGLGVIQEALRGAGATFSDPFWKALLTALTIGSGFKGGEFIPLVFVGSTLGTALGAVLPAPAPLLSALGFAAVFGAGANTPLACTLMAAELFGWEIAPYALMACLLAYYVSGHPGIYGAQTMTIPKHRQPWDTWQWLRRKSRGE